MEDQLDRANSTSKDLQKQVIVIGIVLTIVFKLRVYIILYNVTGQIINVVWNYCLDKATEAFKSEL